PRRSARWTGRANRSDGPRRRGHRVHPEGRTVRQRGGSRHAVRAASRGRRGLRGRRLHGRKFVNAPLPAEALRAMDYAPPKRAHVLVVGNEKGGAGKSTIAIHLAIALMRMGRRVAALDLDVRQRSFDRYLENRRMWAER